MHALFKKKVVSSLHKKYYIYLIFLSGYDDYMSAIIIKVSLLRSIMKSNNNS